MTEREIQVFFRHRSDDAEDRAEMYRIKEQLLRRMAKVMKRDQPDESAYCVARIPEKIVPENIGECVAMDIALLRGETFRRLIINPKGASSVARLVRGEANPNLPNRKCFRGPSSKRILRQNRPGGRFCQVPVHGQGRWPVDQR